MKAQFRGTGVAVVTPFLSNGVIDFDTLEKILEYQIDEGVDYIVSLGTTGEAITLSSDECLSVLNFTKKIVRKRVPIVAGLFGRNDTRALVERIKSFDFEGFAGILSSSPAYNKPTQEGIFQHYMELAKVSPLPIIIYNVPGRTASNVNADTIVRLANASEKFAAVKDASGDLVQGMKTIKNKPAHFSVLSGDDPTCLPLLACGGDGVISVIANAFPREFSTMVNAGMEGDLKTANYINEALLDVHQWLYCEGNPVGIKGAMELLNFGQRDVRLPLVKLSETNLENLKLEMDRAKDILKKTLVKVRNELV
ncbi:MAG: 4-hydroxy-tetrahydrodipicolinate synthase [Saprospiraceae bacterium]